MSRSAITVVLVCLLAWPQSGLARVVSPPASASAPEEAAAEKDNNPVWLTLAAKVVPFIPDLLKIIFKDRKNPEKQKNEVNRNYASQNLNGHSRELASAAQAVNDYVASIIAWRQFANRLDGAGDLREDGSLKDCLVRMNMTVDLADHFSESSLPTVITSLEGENSVAWKQWTKLAELHEKLDIRIEPDVTSLRNSLTELSKGIKRLKDAKEPGETRARLSELRVQLAGARDAVDRLSTRWDNWHRDLGEAFFKYMQRFGAEPNENIQRDNQMLAAAHFELTEASKGYEQALARVNLLEGQLETLDVRVEQASANVVGAEQQLAAVQVKDLGAITLSIGEGETISVPERTREEREQQIRQAKKDLENAVSRLEELQQARQPLGTDLTAAKQSMESFGGRRKVAQERIEESKKIPRLPVEVVLQEQLAAGAPKQ